MKGKIFILIMAIAVTASAAEEKAAVGRKECVLPPLINEKYEYYEVCGCSEKDLQCDLTQKAILCSDGKKYDSVTNWKLKWDYAYNRTRNTCSTDSFRVTVDVIIRLPKWTSANEAPEQLIVKWDSYMQNLIEHEKGHRDRVVEAAVRLTQAVAGLSPALNCGRLDREVQALAREQTQRLIEDQKAYDAATGHGHVQGVVFP